MKFAVFLILNFLFTAAATVASGQVITTAVNIVTLYSQNRQFYLKSIPFDNEIPSLRGKTFVYKTGVKNPLYVLERGFDVTSEDNNLFLSDDGEVIFYVALYEADEEKDGLKSVNIYRRDKLVKSLTETEITGCDEKKERCRLVYYDPDKEIVTEKDKFLDGFPLFSFDDTVYLTDSRLNVHSFDLKRAELIGSKPFDEIYERIKNKARLNQIQLQLYDAPMSGDYPKLKNGTDSTVALANYIGMKPVDIYLGKDNQFKWYSFRLKSSIFQDGSVEVEEIDAAGDHLLKEKILEFFKNSRFDARSIPKVFEKWYLGEEVFFLRKSDDALARREKLEQLAEQREELKKRLVAEKIDGVYIPKNLEEAFPELDRLLSEIDKKEMRALPGRKEMIKYHLTLGMWMRNNWRLWGGSRLQKYFIDKGVTHPEAMSSVVLYYYHDWLSGKKETWKDWEKNPKQ